MITSGDLFCRSGIIVQIKKYMSECNIQLMSDLLGVRSNRAKYYLEKHHLDKKEPHLLAQSIKYCQSLGYSNEDILKTPKLLTKHPLALEHHYLAMQEGGFYSIEPEILSRSIFYMRKSVDVLKCHSVINKDCDVARNLVEHVQNNEIASKIYKYFPDNTIWNEIHLAVLQAFLKWRLEATEDEILILFRIHKMIKNKSFRMIQENIAIAEDIGFSPRKLLKYGYLLNSYPTYTKVTLRDFGNIAGADMRKAMRLYPKLIMTPPTNILKIYGILKEFSIPDEVIRKKMNVFQMCPDTVRLRLEEIERDPNIKILLNHPKILTLILHHNRAKSRLSFLQQLKLRCASLFIIGSHSNSMFENYIREGKDLNKTSDIMAFLKKTFKVDHENIRDRLKKHPYYLNVPLKDMEETYNYLRDSNFRECNISKVVFILLYPVEKIEDAINRLKNKNTYNMKYSSLSQVKKLNLILYVIEKDYHFTGNGIWRNYDHETPEKTLE